MTLEFESGDVDIGGGSTERAGRQGRPAVREAGAGVGTEIVSGTCAVLSRMAGEQQHLFRPAMSEGMPVWGTGHGGQWEEMGATKKWYSVRHAIIGHNIHGIGTPTGPHEGRMPVW